MPINEPPCRSQPITRLARANGCREIYSIYRPSRFPYLSSPATAPARSINRLFMLFIYKRARPCAATRGILTPLATLGPHHYDEYYPPDSSTVAGHDDDIQSHRVQWHGRIVFIIVSEPPVITWPATVKLVGDSPVRDNKKRPTRDSRIFERRT